MFTPQHATTLGQSLMLTLLMSPGVLQSAPKLPPAPQLSVPTKEEPASDPKPAPNPVSKAVTPAKDVPAQAQAAIQEVQQSADETVEAAPGTTSSIDDAPCYSPFTLSNVSPPANSIGWGLAYAIHTAGRAFRC